jgi:hypothetical protein
VSRTSLAALVTSLTIPVMTALPRRHQWLFTRLATELNEEYARIQAELKLGSRDLKRGSRNTQLGGYLAEDVWGRLLADWLPPQYEFGYRKYISLEKPVNGKWRTGEVDMVLFHPAYPRHLRKYREILASGVVAVFSVKTTFEKEHLSEAAEFAAMLRRGMVVGKGKPIGDLVSPLIVGVLAQSHRLRSDPRKAVDDLLVASAGGSRHPREELDLVCIADLNCWTRFPMVDRDLFKDGWMSPKVAAEGEVGVPVATLVINLWEKLSHRDVSLGQIASGFRRAGLAPLAYGQPIYRPLKPLVDGTTYEMLYKWPPDKIVD